MTALTTLTAAKLATATKANEAAEARFTMACGTLKQAQAAFKRSGSMTARRALQDARDEHTRAAEHARITYAEYGRAWGAHADAEEYERNLIANGPEPEQLGLGL